MKRQDTRGGWVYVFVGAGLLATLTGCSSKPAAGAQPKGVTAAQIGSEYHAERATLSLPPGTTWPNKVYDKQGAYEPGVGKNDADAFWWCRWEHAYLTSKGHKQQQALKHLSTIKSKYIYIHSYESDVRASTDKQLAAAALGDPGALRQNYTVNCAPQ